LLRAQKPTFGTLDVAELYRLKESQVAAMLVKRDTSDTERAMAIQRVAAFGGEVSKLIESLPEECGCLVLTRGAVLGSGAQLIDLTPDAGARLVGALVNDHPPAPTATPLPRHRPSTRRPLPALRPRAFERLIRHFKRWTLVYLLAALAAAWFDAHFTVLNVTESLPVRLFLIHRGEQPGRGDYVAFRWLGGGLPGRRHLHQSDRRHVRRRGDQVDRDYFVNCRGPSRSRSADKD
jgi:conjugal transfer pilin signal peptidase TrbI